MADPLTLGSAGTGASGAGSIINAFGALQSGSSSSLMYGYQAGVARLNQQIALQNRDYALATGETEASRYGMKARQDLGNIRAAAGASGLDIGSGSKAMVQDSQQFVTGIDLAQIRNNAARKAYGYTVEADADSRQATMLDRASSDASKAGGIKALSSLISGTTSVADKWLQGTSTGVFGSNSLPKVTPENSNYYVS